MCKVCRNRLRAQIFGRSGNRVTACLIVALKLALFLFFSCVHSPTYISGSKRLYQTDCASFSITSVDLHIPVVPPCGGGLWLISFRLVWFGSKAILRGSGIWSHIPTLEFPVDLEICCVVTAVAGSHGLEKAGFLGLIGYAASFQEARWL